MMAPDSTGVSSSVSTLQVTEAAVHWPEKSKAEPTAPTVRVPGPRGLMLGAATCVLLQVEVDCHAERGQRGVGGGGEDDRGVEVDHVVGAGQGDQRQHALEQV